MKYTIALLTLSLSTFAFAGSGEQDTTARLQAAGTVMNQIMAAPDKGIPEEVLNGAKCIAVVPSMGGVRRHSFRSVAAILASRLAPSQSILSCCS